MRMRRTNVLFGVVIPVILGAAFAGACVWGTFQTAKAKEYKMAVQSVYSGAYSALVSELSNLEVSLSKMQIVGTRPQYIMILEDISRQCGMCAGYLAQIPASHADAADMNSFLVRVGDYASSLSQNMLRGRAITADDVKQLSALRKTCSELSVRMTEHYMSGEYPDDVLTGDGYFAETKYVDDENRQEYPTLIYDGPFSESAEKRKPKGVTGDDITVKQAYICALGYAGKEAQINPASVSDGDIPSYDFSGVYPDGREVDVSISKKGGHLVWFMAEPEGNESGVPEKSVTKKYEKKAKEYLVQHGFTDFTSTYAQYYSGVVLINYAYTEDDVIIYNDLVKVWVDRASGKVIGADARNYLYSHTEREIPDAEITRHEAEMLISGNLDVEQVRVALIPVTPETEALCYEFKGRYGDDAYIVYVNALTGEEQQIFRIINTDEGQLVL